MNLKIVTISDLIQILFNTYWTSLNYHGIKPRGCELFFDTILGPGWIREDISAKRGFLNLLYNTLSCKSLS
jgi:hypothetical protein